MKFELVQLQLQQATTNNISSKKFATLSIVARNVFAGCLLLFLVGWLVGRSFADVGWCICIYNVMHITCVSISRRSVCGVTQVCHLCKYFTTMRKIGINSRFRLLFIIALISLLSWGIVVPFCIVNRFAMTKATHTQT